MSVMGTICALILAATVARAGEPVGAMYPAHVVRVIDGDTFAAEVAVWPSLVARVVVRVVGIDTPELRGACASERTRAVAARDALAALLRADVTLRDVAADRYPGRMDARVLLADGRDVGAVLIAAGHARAYDGRTHRAGWCDPL